MFNQSGIKSVNISGPENPIIINTKTFFAMPCIIADTGVTTGTDGRKIVKAGTPLTGSLTERNTPFTVGTTGAVGIAEHDVDVTTGKANGAVVIFGFIDITKVDESVQTDLKTAAETLPMIGLIG